jgi:hypothetical protein
MSGSNFCIESSCMFNLSVHHVWFNEHTGYFHPSWIYRVIPSKFWTRHEILTSWTYRRCSKPSDLLDLGSCVWFKTWMESPCMFNLFGSKLLDGIFLYVQFVSTSCLVQTFVLNHPVCSTCQYNRVVQFKILYQTWNTDKLNIQDDSIQKFEPDMKYWQVELTGWFIPKVLNPVCSVFHVWFKTIGLNHPVCLICQFFMSGSKLLYWIILYMQLVSTSCLIQNN